MERKLRKDSDYLQPDFYHFSQDSIRLAEIVAEDFFSLPENSWCMDIGAGCGVLGFEIIKKLNKKLNFDFVEIQKDFEPFFYKNLDFVGDRRNNCHFYNVDFRDFPISRKYSIVVSNPPYFHPKNGRQGIDPRKNKCRFFLDGSYHELVLFFKKILLPKGKAFFLSRAMEKRGQEILEANFKDFFYFEKRPLDLKTNLIVLSVLNVERN